MLHQVFSVFDSKSALYGFPYYSVSVPAGKRAFSDMCANPETLINRHPGDFTLFHIGTYDDCTGQVTPFASPESLGKAIEYIAAFERVRPSETPQLDQQNDEGDF